MSTRPELRRAAYSYRSRGHLTCLAWDTHAVPPSKEAQQNPLFAQCRRGHQLDADKNGRDTEDEQGLAPWTGSAANELTNFLCNGGALVEPRRFFGKEVSSLGARVVLLVCLTIVLLRTLYFLRIKSRQYPSPKAQRCPDQTLWIARISHKSQLTYNFQSPLT